MWVSAQSPRERDATVYAPGCAIRRCRIAFFPSAAACLPSEHSTDIKESPDECTTTRRRARTTMRQRRPFPGRRRRPEGKQRPPRPAAGRRADGLHAVDTADEIRSGAAALVRPRPLRAVGRPRLGAALQPAAPDRLRPDYGAAAAVPPMEKQ